MKTNSFEDLIVWQKAHQLVLAVYDITKTNFPKEEMYGLTSQARRAAVSIPANIAEGYKRISKTEKLRFLNISQSSLTEVKYYIILAHDLQYLDKSNLYNKLDEVGRLLTSYAKAIKADIKN